MNIIKRAGANLLGTPTGAGIEPEDLRFNGRFFGRLKRLCVPYWTRKGAWVSWVMLTGVLILSALMPAAYGWAGFLVKDYTDALVNKNLAVFWEAFGWNALITIVGMFFLFTGNRYLINLLILGWRQWLTTDIVSRYLKRRTYFEIASDQSIDNVDQRIQSEVEPLVRTVVTQPQMLMEAALGLSIQAAILFTIAPLLIWVTIGYGLLTILATIWLYPPVIRQKFNITVAEADLRYGILHVRDHAEIVAFYRGEHAELKGILARLELALRRALVNIHYELIIMGGTFKVLDVIWALAPMLVLVPLYMSGKIQYGQIAQATMGAASILGAINTIQQFLPTMAGAAPQVVRLGQILEKYDSLDPDKLDRQRDGKPRIQLRREQGSNSIQIDDMSLSTPGGEQTLVRDLSLTIESGQHWIITGQTGIGKSSLLRALAGLWDRGTGSLRMPTPEEILFLPQKPYMMLGTLREQILYPSKRDDLSNEDLKKLLDKVQLPRVAELHGGFEAVRDWGRILSLGEQQRIAFARVLVSRPKFVFLDEATSAMDVATERLMYDMLAESGATYISVGHRQSVMRLHDHALRLSPGGHWSAVSPQEAETASAAFASAQR